MGAPPGADPQLWSWFVTVDRDRSGQISTEELRQALMNNNWSHFNLETCRLMIGKTNLQIKPIFCSKLQHLLVVNSSKGYNDQNKVMKFLPKCRSKQVKL